MTRNQLFELFAKCIAKKLTYRIIGEYKNGDTILFDFPMCSGGDYFDDDTIAQWSLQRQNTEKGYIEEIDCGTFDEYDDALTWLEGESEKMNRLYVDYY